MIDAVVVLHDSADVVEPCLASLREAAPRRGVRLHVVDNASHDDGADRAQRWATEPVLRMRDNRGFAAGVNAVLRHFHGDWLAVINPDVVVPPAALDGLVDVLESRSQAGLVGPRVRYPDGRPQRSTGTFPTLDTERAHAWLLDRLAGRTGRLHAFPHTTTAVDWVSASCWMVRGEAIRQVGPLDEGYFMYLEDVDYCRRLHDAGWEALATPSVEVVHSEGMGSSGSATLPADGGGEPLLRYFSKFQPQVPTRLVVRTLVAGWTIRRRWHGLRSMLGNRRSRVAADRFQRAIEHAARSGDAGSFPARSIDTPRVRR